MPKINITQAHHVPAAEARKKIDGLGKELADKYGLTSKWISDTVAEVKRTGVSGIIKIEAERVLVDLDLSFALSALKGTVESRIKEEMKKLFEGGAA